jgi:valyl-tRNA synthetase
MNLNDYKPREKIKLTPKDKKILNDFRKVAKEITREMDEFRFYVTSEKIYHYFWHTFCDKIIEDSKTKLSSKKTRKSAQFMLLEILLGSLKLLHPFMPFITEEIYQQMPLKSKKECIMIEDWPK